MTDSVKQTYATEAWYQVEMTEYIGLIIFPITNQGIQIRTDKIILSFLIWVQTLCKG